MRLFRYWNISPLLGFTLGVLLPVQVRANRQFHWDALENGTDFLICNETSKLVYDDSGKAYGIYRRTTNGSRQTRRAKDGAGVYCR